VNAVEARDIFRVYETPEGDTAALQGLTVSVADGEVVVVLGPSGSGKSTLLRILAGLDRPSAGSVRVLGAEVGALRGRRLADYRSRLLGYVEQHYARSLDPELTARELVALQLGLAGVDAAARRARADELLERVGLGDRRDARPPELSGGEQQRVAVCAALGHRPRLVLADEPTGELDAESAALVYRLLGELAREHEATAVIVSHDPGAAAVADRVVRVRDGRVSEEARRGGDETLVVGRGGWVRLPEELLLRAGIGGLAHARLDDGGIVVSAAGGASVSAGAEQEPGVATAAAGTVAELRGVTRAFRERPVLRGLDARLEGGTLTVVTGRSGSGKTTLIELLAGLADPDAGGVIVCGEEVGPLDRDGRADLRRRHVGLVRQEPGLAPFLSARENVELGLALRGVEPDAARERALEALTAVGLAERAEQRAARLSAGERQRAAIARAVAPRPALLLADEPTARLDAANAVTIAGLFVRLAREWGTAVVCATHDPLVIEQADERIDLEGHAALAARAQEPAAVD
jgi:ABC-type lipoprotein export system ATPase subunit